MDTATMVPALCRFIERYPFGARLDITSTAYRIAGMGGYDRKTARRAAKVVMDEVGNSRVMAGTKFPRRLHAD